MPVIKVQHLCKTFQDFTAVDQLTFSVSEAEVYGFLGQNGAGKSTTIRMLLTLVAPSSGEIEIFGMDLRRHRREILRQVGAVIERPDLYKYLTGYENLSILARMSGMRCSRSRLMEQLEMVGLAERASSKVRTYSQGMKQRLGIAIALIHDPRLIILDEPTNGLDPQGIADMRNLILHLSRHLKKTVLVSSHLLSEMEQIASSVLIIDKGRKIVEGTAQSFFDPEKTLLDLEVADGPAAAAILGDGAWAGHLEQVFSRRLVFRLPRHRIPDLNRDLVAGGVGVLSLQPRNSLEEYFLSLTGNNQHVATFAN
jgi:ABC-type multidrug transport system ATPase subunit